MLPIQTKTSLSSSTASRWPFTELALKVFEVRVVQVELALQGSVGHTATAPQEVHNPIEDVVKIHPVPSLCASVIYATEYYKIFTVVLCDSSVNWHSTCEDVRGSVRLARALSPGVPVGMSGSDRDGSHRTSSHRPCGV